MAFQNVQEKNMSLLLSSDAKPRLKWTSELHQRFVEAVHQLGGAEKATPKCLMRVMGIHGLTLYHLKSHLQKYRLGKSPNSPQSSSQNKQEEYKENYISQISEEICDGPPEQQINESLQISQSLQIQMEVQKKLHEQIEVQKHLQLRIEAQGKYLQSVLKKAQDTLAKYHSSSIGIEAAKTELSHLVSLVDTGCNSSSLSVLTEIEGSLLKDSEIKPFQRNGYSPDSSLTSSESSGRKYKDHKKANIDTEEKWRKECVVLSLMEMHPTQENKQNSNGRNGMKRSIESSVDEQNSCQESRKRYHHQVSGNDEEVEMFNFMEPLDLNRKCLND